MEKKKTIKLLKEKIKNLKKNYQLSNLSEKQNKEESHIIIKHKSKASFTEIPKKILNLNKKKISDKNLFITENIVRNFGVSDSIKLKHKQEKIINKKPNTLNEETQTSNIKKKNKRVSTSSITLSSNSPNVKIMSLGISKSPTNDHSKISIMQPPQIKRIVTTRTCNRVKKLPTRNNKILVDTNIHFSKNQRTNFRLFQDNHESDNSDSSCKNDFSDLYLNLEKKTKNYNYNYINDKNSNCIKTEPKQNKKISYIRNYPQFSINFKRNCMSLFKNKFLAGKNIDKNILKRYYKKDIKFNITKNDFDNRIIIDNNESLKKIYNEQTVSNFNNKYNIIYKAKNLKQKDNIKNLFNLLKQHKKYEENSSNLFNYNLLCFPKDSLQEQKTFNDLYYNLFVHKNNFISKRHYTKNIFKQNYLHSIGNNLPNTLNLIKRPNTCKNNLLYNF